MYTYVTNKPFHSLLHLSFSSHFSNSCIILLTVPMMSWSLYHHNSRKWVWLSILNKSCIKLKTYICIICWIVIHAISRSLPWHGQLAKVPLDLKFWLVIPLFTSHVEYQNYWGKFFCLLQKINSFMDIFFLGGGGGNVKKTLLKYQY